LTLAHTQLKFVSPVLRKIRRVVTRGHQCLKRNRTFETEPSSSRGNHQVVGSSVGNTLATLWQHSSVGNSPAVPLSTTHPSFTLDNSPVVHPRQLTRRSPSTTHPSFTIDNSPVVHHRQLTRRSPSTTHPSFPIGNSPAVPPSTTLPSTSLRQHLPC
jgi:hypothetical protein